MIGGDGDLDVIVVGAGIGGLYALKRLRDQGLSVLALEAASGIGGVWYHNGYPGARVDIESLDYCYHFSSELYREWRWTERYASQPELLRYLNHVADRFDLRRHILLDTRLVSATWLPGQCRYRLRTQDGLEFSARFLVMATGNLSAARAPEFPGLSGFQGDWVQASRWPHEPVEIRGRKVAVIGTGSSGVQIIPVVAEQAEQLFVFQRTPNFSVPARNGPPDASGFAAAAADPLARRERLFGTKGAMTTGFASTLSFADYSPEERIARVEQQWRMGGQGMNRIFADQGIDRAVNDFVADIVRSRIREMVADPELAEQLCPYDHPIGTRRLCIDTNYYPAYNRPNVRLVNVAREPIRGITSTGIETDGAHYEVDLIVFALGFHAFTGAIDRIDISNEHGEHPTRRWIRGPETMLGLMTAGFPNFFMLTGPGSPSVLANMVLMNEHHVDFVADLIAHMDGRGHALVEPEPWAQAWWTCQAAEAASKVLRLRVKNYMVHVNDDGSHVFMPYVGGLDSYVAICRHIVADGYRGFAFDRLAAASTA